MNKYQTFRFKHYEFDAATGKLDLHYGYDDELSFTESYTFDFTFANYDPVALDQAIQNLFFLAGVSYYKAFLAPHISVEAAQVNHALASFLNKTYQRGLGEFYYVNQLDPNSTTQFPINSDLTIQSQHDTTGLLIGIGGGKDSLVTVEALRHLLKVATWSVGHRQQLEPLVAEIGLPHFWVERTWDSQLLELNRHGALNGHVPISAILAAVGTIVAILAGYRDVIVSNEHSANEPTLVYEGVAINHQYSKSIEFEMDYQEILRQQYGHSLRYYSFLRPLSEMRIAEAFAETGFEKYFTTFTSCNKAFVSTSSELSWCGECPKCAFVYLILTSFVARERLEALFGGKNLLLEPKLESTYRQLLGIEGDKPLECIGEVQETRQAMHRAQSRFAELAKFKFELDRTYSYKQLHNHAMPEELFAILNTYLTALD